ncbi:MAG: hypothetical protein HYU52_07175 [Acidobacteria bacterium]|nr:hypothetical protein [Acidobacteriota bacterium]
MTRIPRLTKDQVTGEVRDVFESVGRQRGNVPNMYRIFAHRPEILKSMTAHLNAITNTGTVPIRVKELVATFVSRTNHCEY